MGYGCYTIPGYFENAEIKNNEIKEPGWSGKVLYKIKGNEICEPGWGGKTVLKFESGYIKEPGFFGHTLFYVDADGNVTEPKIFFPRKVGYFPLARRVSSYEKESVEVDKSTGERHIHYDNTPKASASYSSSPKTTYVDSSSKIPVQINVTVTQTEHFEPYGPYNEVMAYAKFLNKYSVCKSPFEMKEFEYAHWVFMECGVRNMNELHKELFNKGFYRLANLKEKLSIYKMPEIKEVAVALGIKPSGKKEDLINRIGENATIDDVNAVLKDSVYALSEKAMDWIKEHNVEAEYYFYNPIPNITLDEYRKIRETKSLNDIRKEAWLKEARSDHETFGRNAYYRLASLMKSDNKPEKALYYLLLVLRIDISGVCAYPAIKECPDDPDFRKKEHDQIAFAPGLMGDIWELSDYYDDSIVDEVYSKKLPLDASDSKFMKFIINSSLNGVDFDRKQMKAFLDTRFEELAKNI